VAYCWEPCCIYAHLAVAAPHRIGFSGRRREGGLLEWR